MEAAVKLINVVTSILIFHFGNFFELVSTSTSQGIENYFVKVNNFQKVPFVPYFIGRFDSFFTQKHNDIQNFCSNYLMKC